MPLDPPTCADCGGPRSAGSGQRCLACYRLRTRMKRFAMEAWAVASDLQALAALRAANAKGGAAQLALVALALQDIGESVQELAET